MKNKVILYSILATMLVAVPAVSAAQALRSAAFEARHELRIVVPEGSRQLRIWLAMPQKDPLQQVDKFKVDSPVTHRVTPTRKATLPFTSKSPSRRSKKKLRPLLESSADSPAWNEEQARQPRLCSPDCAGNTKFPPALEIPHHCPAANQHVIIDDRIRELAAKIVGDEKNPVLAARKLYDWVLTNIDYWVKDPKNKKASPVGSTEYCLTTKTGNCTDFHSLWTSLARAAGLPTRMIYGSFFKKELDGQDADQSYHCWPEFYAPGLGWVPHDVAVADIFVGNFQSNADNEKLVRLTTGDGYSGADKTKVDYYFGNIDERRVTWSCGRDLTLSPRQNGGPVNALAKAYVEVDGKAAPEKEVWTRKLTFREIKP